MLTSFDIARKELKSLTKKKSPKQRKIARPVEIFDYDRKWPSKFLEERTKIMGAIGDTVVEVEHVGSTAVPGLCAKPIIDIMVGIRKLIDADNCIEPLESIGYEYVPEYEASIPERRYFRKGPSEMPNKHFHLHMVEHGSDFWKRHLLFRDYLRTNPDAALEYCELKKRLASKYRLNREAYTEAKTTFIESIVSKAKTSQQSR
jgi:GrpB-like predicted nucleotidyltransferase (UPF0157 family)